MAQSSVESLRCHVHSVSELFDDRRPDRRGSVAPRAHWAGWTGSRSPRRRASSRAGDTRGSSGCTMIPAIPPCSSPSGRRPHRPPVPACHPQHRLGRHRHRRPGTSLPGRHRQQPGRLPLRAIYRIDEPDPSSARQQADLRFGCIAFMLCREKIGSTQRVCSTTRALRTCWPSISMAEKPSSFPFRSIRRAPLVDRPGPG